MPANFNKVLLIGNLTRDPELRYIPSGQGVTSFTVACNRNYVSQSGEKKEEVCFVRIIVWGRRAEVCNEYLKKGSPVFVEGRLQSRSWDAPDGSKRSTIEVVAQNVQFLGRAPRGSEKEPSALPPEEAVFEEDIRGGSSDKASIPISEKELKPDEEIPF